MNYLCITLRWLDDRYHGKNSRGAPEWPPSPLRLFQALLAAAYSHYCEEDFFLESFRWLQSESMREPTIIAPRMQQGQRYDRFVPNNDSDKVFARQDRLSTKTVQPTFLLDPFPIHYVWKLPESLTPNMYRCADEICEIARHVTTFGWGVDMAVGSGAIIPVEHLRSLQGECWLPTGNTPGVQLRIPCPATLDRLTDRYRLFMNRLRVDQHTGYGDTPMVEYFSDVPPLDQSAFRLVNYRRASDAVRRPFAAFSILKTDASGFHSFSLSRRSCAVAGMVRHAATSAAQAGGWPEEKIGKFVLGHGESQNGAEYSRRSIERQPPDDSIRTTHQHVPVESSKRFAYLPLPSIEFRGSGRDRVISNIRRVIVTSFADDCASEVAWARRALSGGELIDKDSKDPVAVLSLITESENVIQSYTRTAATWATVTPIVLPGFDDPAHYRRRLKKGTDAQEQKRLLDSLRDRTENLIRKAIIQAGFSQILADQAELEWRKVGFWPGTDLADSYVVPKHLKRFPRFHVRIQWRDAENKPVQVPGPVCLGGGRYYGIGLFAAVD